MNMIPEEIRARLPEGHPMKNATVFQVSLIPQSVTRFQARAALHLAGLLGSVEAMMALPETDALAKLAWQDASEFQRNSPTVLAMASALGMSETQLDDLFVQASKITA